ncbi:mannose-1-phosphate guanylyltransferase/mannose-6-phosphate isomerase [Alphaproteobacteria bacterium]|nr:mannose-1-phosphate guanylyltransferase/mannose-6-phosphate isomerase [Alphaproteobacteria bacterium]
MIYPVILCGGSGERLWPLSRKSYPKQFLELVGDGSLFQQSATRITCETSNPVIVTNDDYRFIVRQQLQEVGIEGADVIIEPEGKNTAPAILVAALHVASRDPSGVMVVMPSDHYIPDQHAFTSMVQHAAKNIQDDQIICLGVEPNRPETGYGYIKVSQTEKQIIEVEQFVEKPSLELAEKYLSEGSYLWNAGIFIVRAGELIELASKLQPEMMQGTKAAYENSNNDLDFIRLDQGHWGKIDGNSFDFAFMEKASSICCMSFEGSWSDLGDWQAVAREKETDNAGNNLIGNVHQFDSKNTLLWSESDDQVLTGMGLENIIAIAMKDAVLVADKSKSQEVKSIVKTLKKNGQRQASDHLYEYRPWGSFKTISRGENFHVKIINILPGGKLSLQSHMHRSEHWVVVKGTASITKGETNFKLLPNESTFIPIGTKHMLQNKEPDHLSIIEVQTGVFLEEEDIIRYDDAYGRL